jgi:predicted GTPase
MKPTILICGQTGAGKSSIVNFYFSKPYAKVGDSAEPVSNGFPPPYYENDWVLFYDCDGYEIGKTRDYQQKLMNFLDDKKGISGIHVVYYVINAAAKKVTDFDKEIIRLISMFCPVAVLLSKIDDCDEDSLNILSNEVGTIANVHIFRVSTRKKFLTEWDKLNVWTKETLKQELIKRNKEENGNLTIDEISEICGAVLFPISWLLFRLLREILKGLKKSH